MNHLNVFEINAFENKTSSYCEFFWLGAYNRNILIVYNYIEENQKAVNSI